MRANGKNNISILITLQMMISKEAIGLLNALTDPPLSPAVSLDAIRGNAELLSFGL